MWGQLGNEIKLGAGEVLEGKGVGLQGCRHGAQPAARPHEHLHLTSLAGAPSEALERGAGACALARHQPPAHLARPGDPLVSCEVVLRHLRRPARTQVLQRRCGDNMHRIDNMIPSAPDDV
jgi:hypothetical protein